MNNNFTISHFDKNSKASIRVNGKKITEETIINHGDRVIFGDRIIFL